MIHETVRARLFARGHDAPSLRIGRFAVLRKLGEGGMGVVYLAYDEQLDRKIAVKLLHPWRADERGQARFTREAQALARLSHPHVIQVHEVGTHDDATFVAMEYVTGKTLREWQDGARPGAERLEVLIQCGRGLEAAHTAGLVHRDFKPENVLVGDDGRARVLDFGLARGLGSGSLRDGDARRDGNARVADDQATSGELHEPITITGTLLGTLAYMAPEQLCGEPCDDSSDQFSFCVAAFEVLFDERPFHGNSVAALLEDMRSRAPSAPPGSAGVSTRVHEAIVRGLAVDPRRRWPGMAALLAELQRELTARQRRPWRWALGGVLGTTVVVGVLAPTLQEESTRTCAIDVSALAGTWDEPRRAQLRRAFASPSLPFAATTGSTVEARLDAWAERWITAQRSACEATHATGLQSEATLERRRACLERERRDVEVITELWLEADVAVIGQAPGLLAALPRPGRCVGPGDLVQDHHAPATPELLDAVEAARDELLRIRLLRNAGQLEDAELALDELRAHAAALQHPPLSLEVRALAGQLVLSRGRIDQGTELVMTVIREASLLGLHELEAELRTLLAHELAGSWSKPEMERLILAEAELAVARLGHADDPREIDLARADAELHARAGDHEAALASFDRAYALARQRDPDDAEQYRIEIGSVLMQTGRLDRARLEYEAALEHTRTAFGPRSPTAAAILLNLGTLASEAGDPERGEALLQQAMEIRAEIFGDASFPVAEARHALAQALMRRGQIEGARAQVEAALEVFVPQLGSTHEKTGQAYNALGVLRFWMEDYRGSVEAYERALPAYAEVYGDEHAELALLRSNIGESLAAQGRHEQALVAYEQAARMFGRTLAPSHVWHALPAKGRGKSMLALGRAEDALEPFERALEILGEPSQEPLELADVRFGLARTLHALGRDPARARALAGLARDDFARLEQGPRAAEISAWLDTTDR